MHTHACGDGCSSFPNSVRSLDDYIDVAELEGTSAETKATYEKIKKYVAEHNDGMKVSNLYIAQVKRKCGIELLRNFICQSRRMLDSHGARRRRKRQLWRH